MRKINFRGLFHEAHLLKSLDKWPPDILNMKLNWYLIEPAFKRTASDLGVFIPTRAKTQLQRVLCLVLSNIVTWSSSWEIKSFTCKFFQLLMGSGPQTAGPAAWGALLTTGEPLTEAASRYRALPQNVLYHLKDTNGHLWDRVGNTKIGRPKGTRTKMALTFRVFSIDLAQNVLDDWGLCHWMHCLFVCAD